jgi:Ni/Fe-hydrogenase subunit HybB-like protein
VNPGFEAIEGKSKRYYLLVAILAALTVMGLICFVPAYVTGHQILGGNNAVPWGLPIVLTIYLIGLSAGSLILSSLTYVFGREEYKPIAKIAVFLALVLIFGAMVSIAVDLGRPEKVWRLFMFFYLNNMSSMFAVNGILYGGYFIIIVGYLGFIFADQPRLTRITGILAISWAVLVHMGTGAIFGFIAARETWVSPIKPFEFLAAALTSGLALLIVVIVLTWRFSGRNIGRGITTSLGSLLSVFIVTLFVFVFLEKLTHLYTPNREAVLFTLVGPFSWIFWVFQMGMGVIIPLAILFHPGLSKTVRGVTLASLSVVIGIFFERYYLVIPGAAYPQHYFPGKIEGVYGAVGQFQLTFAELGLSVGIVALLGLVYLLGLKYLELLPVMEGEIPASSEASATE